jgi:hypothetical protein
LGARRFPARAGAPAPPLLAGTVAFQPRYFLPGNVEITLKLRNTIKKQLNASTMSLSVIPEVRLRRRLSGPFLPWP